MRQTMAVKGCNERKVVGGKKKDPFGTDERDHFKEKWSTSQRTSELPISK